MIHFQVRNSDWSTAKTYWKDLCKQLVSSDDQKKVDFVNKIIFESCGPNELSETKESTESNTITTTTTEIPSINTMNEIMKEIDNEVAITTAALVNTHPMGVKEEITTFIVEPVNHRLSLNFFLC